MRRLRFPLRFQHLTQKHRSTTIMAPHLENGTASDMQAASVGDLNNVSAMRVTKKPIRDPDYAYRTLAIIAKSEDHELRQHYRPFLLDDIVQNSDWISRLELATVTKMAEEDFRKTGQRLRVLVIYGSMRKRYDGLSWKLWR
jgi:hypothetical protein